ncbi:MAG: T9SS type A sorting domain-containing protein [Ignavibacteria bacterium]|nr:T9SS type A sorting domain-containing protein [Ignavibacteria bacterium]
MKKLVLILLIFVFHDTYSQWYQQQSPLPSDKIIQHIDFVNADKGWGHTTAATQNDTSHIIRTTNGGTNWFVQYYKKGIVIQHIKFFNDTLGYASGARYGPVTSLFMRTTNAGQNWEEISLPFGLGFDDMFFLNKDTGWVCISGVFNGAWFTSDGGASWESRSAGMPSNDGPQRIYFINGRFGYCAGGSVYRTTNCGISWIHNFETPQSVFSFCFTDSLNGFMGYSNSYIAKTTNAGANWDYRKFKPKGNATITDIQFYNQSTGWLVEAGIYKTTNGGLNWGIQQINLPATSYGADLSIIDSNIGYNSGGFNPVLKSTNGGGPVTSINQISSAVPKDFKIYQNYPNPFNPKTTIRFSIKENSSFTLSIFDLSGKLINKYNSNNVVSSGMYEIQFDGSNLSSGTYLYKLEVFNSQNNLNYNETKKMMLIK